jgi:hypothetical protein
VVGTPFVAKRSFTATGTPSISERRSPRAARASAAAAAARARSAATARNAPSRSSVAAMRASEASTSSADDTARAAIPAPASRRERAVSSGATLTR